MRNTINPIYSIFLKIIVNFTRLNHYYFILNHHVTFFFNKQFVPTFWKYFKKFFFKKFGINTSNVTKSLIFWSIKDMSNLVLSRSVPGVLGVKKAYPYTTINTLYSQPIQIISFAFHKTIYNTFMFYILYILIYNYNSLKTTFNLFYSFINFPPNFILYPFINIFYFKIRHY